LIAVNEPKSADPSTGKRRTAREMAVQMLYQSDLGGSTLPSIFNSFDLAEYVAREVAAAKKPKEFKERGAADAPDEQGKHRRRVEEAFRFAQDLVRGTVDHREQIDEMIRGQADNWRLERMPPVDRNILRLAVYEMLYQRDTPKLVVVDEAIELAKKFGSDQSGRFVNGLLDGLLKQHAFPGSMT
jgi:N utilization substance protein B